MQLTATYKLTNKYTGQSQGYYAGRNIEGLTEVQIRKTISEGLKNGSPAMIMTDRTVIVSDRKKRIHYTFIY